ncbi:succinate dehydrogenase assembly factor 2 [Endozoicomonas ascidiicola]|uniref:FAD assembly factor SdhE n=1 Tax=Endozoicomonas ascidiicola TaxID=1698521 RepID=UPI00082CBF17|nr:succinate dehydrogenase assembly factor 2 [Endozoicomonas ascidiicola]
MLDQDQLKCLQWRSRRGMLELDVLLEPFTRDALPEMNEADQLAYVRLLECEDPDLFSWFMSGDRPADPELSRMVDRVLDRGRYQGEAM